jgi:hypothetical protein
VERKRGLAAYVEAVRCILMANRVAKMAIPVNILVGSFGLVTVAPFTAVVAGLLYRVGRSENPASTAPMPGGLSPEW